MQHNQVHGEAVHDDPAVDADAHGRNALALALMHPLIHDPLVVFDEGPHTYHVLGQRVPRSTTGIKKKYFEPFDADDVIEKCYGKWCSDDSNEHHHIIRRVLDEGGSVAHSKQAIKDHWSLAGTYGTEMHLFFELWCNNEAPSRSDARFAHVQSEIDQFNAWSRDVGMTPLRERAALWAFVREAPEYVDAINLPFRTELSVFLIKMSTKGDMPHELDSTRHVPYCAGQIDFLGERVHFGWSLFDESQTSLLEQWPELALLTPDDEGAMLWRAQAPADTTGVVLVVRPDDAKHARWAAGLWDVDATGVVRYPMPPWHEKLGRARFVEEGPPSADFLEAANDWYEHFEGVWGVCIVRVDLKHRRVTFANGQTRTVPLARQFWMADWKRIKPNKSVQPSERGYRNRMCKHPLARYPQTEHVQFSLQLSMYTEQLRINCGIEMSRHSAWTDIDGPTELAQRHTRLHAHILRMHADLTPDISGLRHAEQVEVTNMQFEARQIMQEELETVLHERDMAENDITAAKRRIVAYDARTGRFADARCA